MASEQLPIHGMIEGETIPPGCANGEAMKCGIDEAGRGPVLGAMTFGLAFWGVADDAEVEKLGFDDSKALTHERRVHLFEGIKKERRIGWAVNLKSAAHLSALMLRRRDPVSLNKISFDATVELIARARERGANIVEAFVDTVGDPESYRERLFRAFDGAVAFTVAKKADSLYKTVGAASICAKVTRDASIAAWVYEEPSARADMGFGSGYPGDEACKAWLVRNTDPVFGLPSFARFSWATTKELLGDDRDEKAEKLKQPSERKPRARVAKVTWDELEADDPVASSMKITEWATVSKKKQAAPPQPKRRRAHFFRDTTSLQAFF